VKAESRSRGASFRDTLNDLLRISLLNLQNKPQTRSLKIKPTHMGYRAGLNYDDIESLLENGEGEQHSLPPSTPTCCCAPTMPMRLNRAQSHAGYRDCSRATKWSDCRGSPFGHSSALARILEYGIMHGLRRKRLGLLVNGLHSPPWFSCNRVHVIGNFWNRQSWNIAPPGRW
jgi:hypothetical protein